MSTRSVSGVDLIIKHETEGLETEEEVIALAQFYLDTRMYRSVGHAGRFIQSVIDTYGEEVLS
jgi:hypothetical protein